MIQAVNLSKSFGAVKAVKDISFCARDGQITGLLGPNGAGKSTTLRMLYGLVQPDTGQAIVDQIDAAKDANQVRRLLGALPDAHGLYPRLTARENIAYFGRLHSMPERKLQQRINELIDILGMDAFADRKVAGFSQGQRMKVSIARAIVHNPKNIILDEPTNGLDVMSTRAMRELITHMKDSGQCVLFSSHVMQEVAALCDQVVIIVEGKVGFSGTIAALKEEYEEDLENAFVSIVAGYSEQQDVP